ncbi:MAG: PadR family transcriptional regulator [Cuniculiplasma sp.]
MNLGEYSDSALFILSLKPMSGYELSRKLKWDGSMVSGGTIRPLLKSLERHGFIRYEMRGRAKVYSLTSKGEKYVSNLRSFRENIRERMLAVSMGRDLLFPDVLASIEDTTILNEAIDLMALTIIRQVKVAFVLKKDGNNEGIDRMIQLINDSIKQVLQTEKPKVKQ